MTRAGALKNGYAADDIRCLRLPCGATAPTLVSNSMITLRSPSSGREKMRAIRLVRLALALILLAPLALACPPTAQAQPDKLAPQVRKFIGHMARAHGFDVRALRTLLAGAQPNREVLRAVAAPVTSRPWYQFRPLCVDDMQVSEGVQFWHDNAALLERARRDFGVPEDIVIAVIAIESRFGRYAGGYRVIDSLYTLAFVWPNRAAYFRGELEQFLVLAREQGWDAGSVQGSFAGALGWPQFMPSSYRRFALDYSGDGRVDLWDDVADIVGSVANYLQQSGWRDGQPVAARAQLDGIDPNPLLQLGPKPQLLSQWAQRGVSSAEDIAQALSASLFALELADGPEYWLGFDNFHILLRYNPSRNYAMAVYQLAQEIRAQHERPGLAGSD